MTLLWPFNLLSYAVAIVFGVVLTLGFQSMRRDPRLPRSTLDRDTRRRLARNAPHLRIVRDNERRSS